MSASILDGKTAAAQLKKHIATEVYERVKNGLRIPALAVIQVGEDPASQVYVRNKRRACEAVGIKSLSYDLPETVTEVELLALIDTLNADSIVDGILVQLPLPKTIDTNNILDRIDPEKDVDGFHPYNLGCLAQQRPTLRPCTPHGIITLLQTANIEIKGLHAVIVGASNIVGRPLIFELLLAKATVTVCHSMTQSLETHVFQADLLITAIGKPRVIQSNWIKPGAIVVDVGINRLPNGKIVGDIEFNTAKERAAWITPVPGGVGPMTVATLLENTLSAAKRRKHHSQHIANPP